jgi:hypothetical protein
MAMDAIDTRLPNAHPVMTNLGQRPSTMTADASSAVVTSNTKNAAR